jgi:hypothetical protein
MPELGSYGSVRGAAGNSRPYRDRRKAGPIHALKWPASEKRQGTKSRWVGHWRRRGLYGELNAASGSKRMRRSGRVHGFGPRRECPFTADRADRGVVEQNGAGDAVQSDGPTQAGAMPGRDPARIAWVAAVADRP